MHFNNPLGANEHTQLRISTDSVWPALAASVLCAEQNEGMNVTALCKYKASQGTEPKLM